MPDSPSSLYSLDKLRGLYMNNEAFVAKTVEVFVVQIKEDMDMMKKWLTDRDWIELRKVAHKMKPNIDLLEMASIQQDIRFIEKNGSEETMSETALKTQRVCEVIESVRTHLKIYLKENSDKL